MSGITKGLLLDHHDEPLVVRARRVLEEALGADTCVLVGSPKKIERSSSPYAALGIETVLNDDPDATGPLAGLLALLEHGVKNDVEHVIAVACDMPLISRELVHRLANASSAAGIVASKRGAFWDPFFARYVPRVVLPIARRFAAEGGGRLQVLFDRAESEQLALNPEEEATLIDWDTPEDRTRSLQDAKARGKE